MESAKTTNGKPAETVTPGPSGPLANVRTSTAQPSRVPLFALIIGINAYPNLTKLTGAVADANAFKDYLQEVVRVPEEHIRTLCDDRATRSAILGEFKELCADKRIRNGNPIVIFYAGHGGELPSPHKWERHGNIQCILPYDYEYASIDPIPDCSIAALIKDIANAKGNNITVILDCCYSASGTRDADEEYVPRSVILNHRIPEDLDHQIWGGRAGTIPKGLAYHGLRSHVLLAACGEKELAYEHEGRGQFTAALLKTLKESGLSELTYTGLIKCIRLPKQHPQLECDSFHRDRALFNGRVSAGRQVRHSVRVLSDFKYVISAGLAHGVSRGAEFTLYSNDKQRVNTLAVDDTAVIEDFQTTVATSVHLTDDSFGRLSRIGKVPFYLPPAESLPASFLEALNGNNADATNFRLVEEADEAKLEVGAVGERGVFKILDQRINGFGLINLAHTIPPRYLTYVLDTAAHYYWYLDLTNKNSRAEHAVAVDFYPLSLSYDDWGYDLWTPIEPGLCQRDRSRGNSELDVIDFVVDPDAVYGVKFTNNTPVDLYLNVFLFNSSKLSIDQCYTQSSVGNPEAPLKRNGTFTLGFGTGGAVPLAFLLDEGQDVDVSYLKAYFATQPIDLSWIAQASPIEDLDEREFPEEEARKARLSVSKSTQPRGGAVDTWFTVEIPIVQRRR